MYTRIANRNTSNGIAEHRAWSCQSESDAHAFQMKSTRRKKDATSVAVVIFWGKSNCLLFEQICACCLNAANVEFWTVISTNSWGLRRIPCRRTSVQSSGFACHLGLKNDKKIMSFFLVSTVSTAKLVPRPRLHTVNSGSEKVEAKHVSGKNVYWSREFKKRGLDLAQSSSYCNFGTHWTASQNCNGH